MEQWIDILVTMCGKPLYHFCYHLTGTKEAADDLYQETFLKAMEKEDALIKVMEENNVYTQEGMERTKNYLIGIALRIWKYQCRKETWRRRITPEDARENAVLEIAAIDTGPEDLYLKKEAEQEIKALVDNLPERLRIVVILFYSEEMSTKEIAKKLGIPGATVRSRLNRARKQMREEYRLHFAQKEEAEGNRILSINQRGGAEI